MREADCERKIDYDWSSQSAFTFWKLTIETLQQDVNPVLRNVVKWSDTL